MTTKVDAGTVTQALIAGFIVAMIVIAGAKLRIANDCQEMGKTIIHMTVYVCAPLEESE